MAIKCEFRQIFNVFGAVEVWDL